MDAKDWVITLGGIISVVTTFLLSRRKQQFDEKEKMYDRHEARIATLEKAKDECMEENAALREKVGEAMGLVKGMQSTIDRLEATIGKASDRAAAKTAEMVIAKSEQTIDQAVAKAAEAVQTVKEQAPEKQ